MISDTLHYRCSRNSFTAKGRKERRRKKGWECNLVVECLPSMYKALDSNPSTLVERKEMQMVR
jgi:hypothetical protein